MQRISIIIILLSFLSACAAIKVPQATGGSKADGVVEMSYQYGAFEKPQVQWDQALVTATSGCKAWGYSSAEAFGGTTSQCQAYNGYGNCIRQHVTAKYQCVGQN